MVMRVVMIATSSSVGACARTRAGAAATHGSCRVQLIRGNIIISTEEAFCASRDGKGISLLFQLIGGSQHPTSLVVSSVVGVMQMLRFDIVPSLLPCFLDWQQFEDGLTTGNLYHYLLHASGACLLRVCCLWSLIWKRH